MSLVNMPDQSIFCWWSPKKRTNIKVTRPAYIKRHRLTQIVFLHLLLFRWFSRKCYSRPLNSYLTSYDVLAQDYVINTLCSNEMTFLFSCPLIRANLFTTFLPIIFTVASTQNKRWYDFLHSLHSYVSALPLHPNTLTDMTDFTEQTDQAAKIVTLFYFSQ